MSVILRKPPYPLSVTYKVPDETADYILVIEDVPEQREIEEFISGESGLTSSSEGTITYELTGDFVKYDKSYAVTVYEDIKPEAFLQYENKLIARTGNDPRLSSNGSYNAITNILITNIRSANDSVIYKETAGARTGRGTIYEIATVEPFTGPFGNTEYYKMLWRRTENQTVGD